jgi:uncharacterized damage-inducible protein DinB
MAADWFRRPASAECHPHFHAYVDRVPEDHVIEVLERQLDETAALLEGLPAERGRHRYAPGKWSVHEVVGHVVDVERVFSLRALWFARGDARPLPGMEQDDFVAAGRFDARTLASLSGELRHVRLATLDLLRSFDEEILDRTGVASEVSFTVRAIAFILAGHEAHHVGVLRDRYLSG